LAEATGLAAPYISQLETRKREGTIETFKKIAAILRVDIDDIAQELIFRRNRKWWRMIKAADMKSEAATKGRPVRGLEQSLTRATPPRFPVGCRVSE
jgi:transcriptional regulator with XRE-family HTH domain